MTSPTPDFARRGLGRAEVEAVRAVGAEDEALARAG
jgi:hypothetical protein